MALVSGLALNFIVPTALFIYASFLHEASVVGASVGGRRCLGEEHLSALPSAATALSGDFSSGLVEDMQGEGHAENCEASAAEAGVDVGGNARRNSERTEKAASRAEGRGEGQGRRKCDEIKKRLPHPRAAFPFAASAGAFNARVSGGAGLGSAVSGAVAGAGGARTREMQRQLHQWVEEFARRVPDSDVAQLLLREEEQDSSWQGEPAPSLRRDLKSLNFGWKSSASSERLSRDGPSEVGGEDFGGFSANALQRHLSSPSLSSGSSPSSRSPPPLVGVKDLDREASLSEEDFPPDENHQGHMSTAARLRSEAAEATRLRSLANKEKNTLSAYPPQEGSLTDREKGGEEDRERNNQKTALGEETSLASRRADSTFSSAEETLTVGEDKQNGQQVKARASASESEDALQGSLSCGQGAQMGNVAEAPNRKQSSALSPDTSQGRCSRDSLENLTEEKGLATLKDKNTEATESREETENVPSADARASDSLSAAGRIQRRPKKALRFLPLKSCADFSEKALPSGAETAHLDRQTKKDGPEEQPASASTPDLHPVTTTSPETKQPASSQFARRRRRMQTTSLVPPKAEAVGRVAEEEGEDFGNSKNPTSPVSASAGSPPLADAEEDEEEEDEEDEEEDAKVRRPPPRPSLHSPRPLSARALSEFDFASRRGPASSEKGIFASFAGQRRLQGGFVREPRVEIGECSGGQSQFCGRQSRGQGGRSLFWVSFSNSTSRGLRQRERGFGAGRPTREALPASPVRSRRARCGLLAAHSYFFPRLHRTCCRVSRGGWIVLVSGRKRRARRCGVRLQRLGSSLECTPEGLW